MDANTEISLDVVHQAVVDAIAAQFPSLVVVDDYRDDRERLPLPAVLVELEDMEGAPDVDPGTEQLPVVARWSARVVIGFRTTNAKREIRRLSAAIAAFIHQNRFGQPVEPANVLLVGPDDWEPELDRYETWRVEWQQVIHLGATVWTNDGTVPDTILYSWKPEIGAEHEDKYKEITSGEDFIE